MRAKQGSSELLTTLSRRSCSDPPLPPASRPSAVTALHALSHRVPLERHELVLGTPLKAPTVRGTHMNRREALRALLIVLSSTRATAAAPSVSTLIGTGSPGTPIGKSTIRTVL